MAAIIGLGRPPWRAFRLHGGITQGLSSSTSNYGRAGSGVGGVTEIVVETTSDRALYSGSRDRSDGEIVGRSARQLSQWHGSSAIHTHLFMRSLPVKSRFPTGIPFQRRMGVGRVAWK